MPSPIAPSPSRSSSPPVSRAERPAAQADPGFAVYVHWPFCQAKCPYCDFNSHVRSGGIDEARFRAAYLAELDHMRALTGPREVASVFFGGGTPSLMDPRTTQAILDHVAALWSLPPDAEVTLEANPTSVEAERFAGYRAAGVNRASLGVQALDDASLRRLGRLHSAAEALAALDIAQSAFARVSFDLIYARTRQTPGDWEAELARALSFGVSHLSLYQLTIEEGTPFAALHAAGKLSVPTSDAGAAFYEATQALCEGAGLPAYEISNHARPGEECRHNLVYWRMGEWAGVGPGAHGRVGMEGGARRATATLKNPEAWAQAVEARGHGIAEETPLAPEDIAEEMLMMGLRLCEGLDLARYARSGGRLDAERVAWLEAQGLVARDATRLTATPAGRLVLNALVGELAG